MRFFDARKYLFIVLLIASGCSQNLLIDLGSKTTDEAYLQDAQQSVNAMEYQNAINIITQKVSSNGQTKVLAKEILASGYAGRCGLNFIDFVTSLSKASTGSAFILVATPFVGRDVDPVSCLQALNTLDSIGASAGRTNNQNAFASVVGMSLMGSAIRSTTDVAGAANGDGIEDSPNISCSLTNDQIDLIILGFGFMSQNFAALSAGEIGVTSKDRMSEVISKCSATVGGSCEITKSADITDPIRDTIRDLMNTSDYGIGTYHPPSDLAIPAACP